MIYQLLLLSRALDVDFLFNQSLNTGERLANQVTLDDNSRVGVVKVWG